MLICSLPEIIPPYSEIVALTCVPNVYKLNKNITGQQNKEVPATDARIVTTATGIQFAFSTQLWAQLSKTSHEGKKIEKQNSQQTGGWQHATNEKRACVAARPIACERTRDQHMSAARLAEVGCAAADGRVGGVSGVRANPVNRVPGNWAKGHSSLES